MNQIPPESGLVVAAVLFALGLGGVLARRNMLFVLMSIEIMLNAAALAMITAGARHHAADGQVMFMFILATAAAEVAVGLAIVLLIYRSRRTLDVDEAREMRG
jgi:NADH-quinone oxidoreductase subunit K